MQKSRYKYIILGLMLASSLLFAGAGKSNTVMLDTEQYILYHNIAAQALLTEYTADKEDFADAYKDGYMAVQGTVEQVSANGKSFKLSDGERGNSAVFECKAAETSVVQAVKGLRKGDSVLVYGQVKVNFFTKEASMNVDKVEVVQESDVPENQYITLSGAVYDMDNIVEVSLRKGTIKYSIPHSWESVSKKLENITLDGYQYCLNEIDRKTVKAESFFVFYFDNEKELKNLDDRTRAGAIQVAIANNILKKDAGTALEFKREKYETYYGANYNYYCDTYTNFTSGETYRVEFVFETVKDDGMLVYLYVVNHKNEDRHIEDIMMVMKSANQ